MSVTNRNPWLDVASYSASDANRFKGRSDDVAKFLKIVSSGTMSVLYADSGIGKTSFINAGVVPAMVPEGYYPLHILFPDDVYEQEQDVEQWLLKRMQELCQWQYVLAEPVSGCEQSLWWLLHACQIIGEGQSCLKPFIIFDQFEEVFVKSRKGANHRFEEQLFRLVETLSSSSLPPAVEQALEREAARGVLVDVDVEHRYKVVFSLRKEYLSDFDYWTNDRYSVSELHQNRMLLRPLTRRQAEQVITQQPNEQGDGFVDVLVPIKDDIISKIDESGHDEVDPFILSLLCSRLYEEAVSSDHAQALDDVKPESVIWNFYTGKMNSIVSNEDHLKVIEETLVDETDGSRHRPEVRCKDFVKIGFSEHYCLALEDAHLVRTDIYNDKTYVELSHDMLARAIQRHREEERRQHQLAEATRWLKLRQNVLYGVIAILVAGGCLLSWHLWNNAREAERLLLAKQQSDYYHTVVFEVGDDPSFPDNYRWLADVRVYRRDCDSLVYSDSVSRWENRLLSFDLHDTIIRQNKRPVRIEIIPRDSLKLCMARVDSPALERVDSQVVHLSIRRNANVKFPFCGRVFFPSGQGDTIFVNNAFVALGNDVVRTDDNGYFSLSLNNPKEMTKGCLTVFKRDFRYMQYEMELLARSRRDTVLICLPLRQSQSPDSLFDRKLVAIDMLYWQLESAETRDLEMNAAERVWLREIGVLGRDKSRLHSHRVPKSAKFGELKFLSRFEGDDQTLSRPVFGFYKSGGADYLFDGAMTLLYTDKSGGHWRLRLTAYDRKRFHTEEHSLILLNPDTGKCRLEKVE